MLNIKSKRLLKSFQYAVKGLIKIFREEQNIRIQVLVGVFVLCCGYNFHLKRIEWCIIIILITIVILMEIINSAIERIADVLKPRIDSYVKEIKDIMAGAVMIASILAVIIGIIIFWPYLFN